MKLLLILILAVMLSATVFGQVVTTIADVQDTTGTGGSGDSKLKGQVVTVEGTVSGEAAAFGGKTFYIQDGTGPWSGVMVYDGAGRVNAYGDSIKITGTVTEYSGMTELTDITEYVKLDSGKTVEPSLVTTGEIASDSSNAEAYEGVLVKVMDVVVDDADLGYGEWSVDDGSGACRVDDAADYYFIQANYETVKSIVGLLNYSFGDTKIEPRLAWDIVESGKYTRLQRIQQVRHSDLLKAFDDAVSDISYANGDTLTVKGVVTMPTGLSYAGAGIKFIFGEPEGGPWSAILSYHPDSTAYPALFEGDLIEMTGYISEYQTGPSNMTEFFITSPINILDIAQPLPDPNMVATGDLRLPETAEQWGNVMVYAKNAKVTNVNPAFELFAINDGSGSVLVDDDSDSLQNYYSANPIPSLGTNVDSIRGWVYHHYGSYADSSAYKLEPLYMWDIKLGGGPPPSISNATRDKAVPTSSDEVTITADVATTLTITEVALYYNVSSGEPVGDYTKVMMTLKDGLTYEAKIPAQAEGSFVNYYINAKDDQDQSSNLPAVKSIINMFYVVNDGDLTIGDVQYTPWKLADSPLEGMNVSLTAIVTTDTAANNNYEAYALQDAGGKWNGLFAFGINEDLNLGDEITVHGTITDYNPDWSFKWDNNTVILVDSFSTNSSGNEVLVANATTGELKNDTTTAEAFEGVVVKISDATLVSLNSYDVTFDDGSGEVLVDGDFVTAADQDPNDKFYINSAEGYVVAWGDTVRLGEKVAEVQGVFTFSFGTFKISLRGPDDFGVTTGIDPDFKAQPYTYNLNQNYPNPFNPETRISFEIPQAQDVTLVIYNVLGQKVRTLINESYNAGRHVVNWDGLSEYGVRVPTGMYFYRIKSGDFVATKKMLMVK